MKLVYFLPLLLVLSIGFSQAYAQVETSETYDTEVYGIYVITYDTIISEGNNYFEIYWNDKRVSRGTAMNSAEGSRIEVTTDSPKTELKVITGDLIIDNIQVTKTGQLNDAQIESNFPETLVSEDAEIPEWVRGIFKFWVDKQISDREMLGAIQFLIDQEILKPTS